MDVYNLIDVHTFTIHFYHPIYLTIWQKIKSKRQKLSEKLEWKVRLVLFMDCLYIYTYNVASETLAYQMIHHTKVEEYMLPVVGSSYGVVVVGLSGVVVVMSRKENRGYRNVCKYVSVKRGSSKIHENP